MSLMFPQWLGLFYHRVAKLSFLPSFPYLVRNARSRSSCASQDSTFLALLTFCDRFDFFFLFASYFSSYSNSPWGSPFGLVNCKGGASYSLSWKEMVIWGWHYLAVELWHGVAFAAMEPCCSFRSAPLCVRSYCEGERGLLLVLLFFSSHVHLSTLALCCWIFGNCRFPWRSLSLQHCLHFSISGHLCVILSCTRQYIRQWVMLHLVN